MSNDPENFLWVEKYRPSTVEDTILPANTKKKFQKYVDDGVVPNLLLVGPPGVGKTTIAKAMLEQIGCDYIVINGSMNGGIDSLRYDIANFASTLSFSGKRKYVIIDEADYLPARSTQPALRNFTEEFSSNCGFILTANYEDKILAPIRSRFSRIPFTIENGDKAKMAGEFFKRVCNILETEKVEYEQKAIVAVIQQYFPDWRRVLVELQNFSAAGTIDMSIVKAMSSNADIDKLIRMLKAKDFPKMRQWVESNADMDSAEFYSKLYDLLPESIDSNSGKAGAILVLAQYQYQESFAANPVINRAAALVEIMSECDFK